MTIKFCWGLFELIRQVARSPSWESVRLADLGIRRRGGDIWGYAQLKTCMLSVICTRVRGSEVLGRRASPIGG